MSSLNALSESFTRQVPNLRRMANSKFVRISIEARQECVANALALTWMFIFRLWKKGRSDEPNILRSCLWYAVKQTKEGRTPQGCPRKRDTLTRRWVGPSRLPDFDLEQFVSRNTPIPAQVSFRVDVPAFMGTLNNRQRQIAVDLANGMTTTDAAEKHQLSMGRISQYRRELKDLFDVYFAD